MSTLVTFHLFTRLNTMYRADLSDETGAFGVNEPTGAKYVGWLDKEHPFNTGQVNEELIKKLESIKPSKLTAGWHVCELCYQNGHPWPVEEEQRSSYSIRICSKDGIIFEAPKMIVHYIRKHNYLPPPEYIEALSTGLTENDHKWKENIQTYMNRLKQMYEKAKALKIL